MADTAAAPGSADADDSGGGNGGLGLQGGTVIDCKFYHCGECLLDAKNCKGKEKCPAYEKCRAKERVNK